MRIFSASVIACIFSRARNSTNSNCFLCTWLRLIKSFIQARIARLNANSESYLKPSPFTFATSISGSSIFTSAGPDGSIFRSCGSFRGSATRKSTPRLRSINCSPARVFSTCSAYSSFSAACLSRAFFILPRILALIMRLVVSPALSASSIYFKRAYSCLRRRLHRSASRSRSRKMFHFLFPPKSSTWNEYRCSFGWGSQSSGS